MSVAQSREAGVVWNRSLRWLTGRRPLSTHGEDFCFWLARRISCRISCCWTDFEWSSKTLEGYFCRLRKVTPEGARWLRGSLGQRPFFTRSRRSTIYPGLVRFAEAINARVWWSNAVKCSVMRHSKLSNVPPCVLLYQYCLESLT